MIQMSRISGATSSRPPVIIIVALSTLYVPRTNRVRQKRNNFSQFIKPQLNSNNSSFVMYRLFVFVSVKKMRKIVSLSYLSEGGID